MLIKYIEKVKYFKEVKGGVIAQEIYCKYLKYKHFAKDSIIYNEGAISNAFYIILRGEVSLRTYPN